MLCVVDSEEGKKAWMERGMRGRSDQFGECMDGDVYVCECVCGCERERE